MTESDFWSILTQQILDQDPLGQLFQTIADMFRSGQGPSLPEFVEQLRDRKLPLFLFAYEFDGPLKSLDKSGKPPKYALWASTKVEPDTFKTWLEHREWAWLLDEQYLIPQTRDFQACQEILKDTGLICSEPTKQSVTEVLLGLSKTKAPGLHFKKEHYLDEVQNVLNKDPELSRACKGMTFKAGNKVLVHQDSGLWTKITVQVQQ